MFIRNYNHAGSRDESINAYRKMMKDRKVENDNFNFCRCYGFEGFDHVQVTPFGLLILQES